MEKFKLLKFPKFFTSSCKTQNLDEVIDHGKNPIFTPQSSTIFHSPLIEKIHENVVEKNGVELEKEEEEKENYPFNNNNNFVIKTKPKNLISFSSSHQNNSSSSSSLMCKPRCPETFDQMVRESCIISSIENNFNRRKVAGKYNLLSPSGDFSGRRCPPTSPATPLFIKQGNTKKKKKQKQKEKSNSHFRNSLNGFKSNPFSFSSSNETEDDDNGGDWFSSSDEREYENKHVHDHVHDHDHDNLGKFLNFNNNNNNDNCRGRRRAKARPPRRRKAGPGPEEVGVVPLKGKVKDTFAVVKSSSDPYNDFRTSMVEMIIDKQIFGAKELEELLKCFLGLNSKHHHRVIIRVFDDICDALFSHCS